VQFTLINILKVIPALDINYSLIHYTRDLCVRHPYVNIKLQRTGGKKDGQCKARGISGREGGRRGN